MNRSFAARAGRVALAGALAGLAAPAVAQPDGGGDVSPNWFRNTAISPDGETILFQHAGDIYTVPVEGGRAIPLTIHEAYESHPVWSRDGSMVAFASDRFGNDDVFVMPARGGAATRLTFHSADDHPSDFTPDGSAVLFTSARLDDVDSALFPSGVLAELYTVSARGGTPDMLLTTPALNARYSPDGSRILYEDRKGYEDPLRKHHESSIARDVWVYDIDSGEHAKLTDFEGEDREPAWLPGGREMLFLSEQAGDFNVFRKRVRPGADATRLTRFEDHPVRHLSVSDGGRAAFSWHGDVYVMEPGRDARRVPIEIAVEGRVPEARPVTFRGDATEFAVSPSGKEVAFVVHGEVFATSVDFGTTRRITDTPEQERSVSFSPDGRSLIYAGERDGSWNIYEATIADDDELYFFSATKIEETPVIDSDREEFQPAYSPDGEKIAYLLDRSQVNVLDRESGETSVALPGDRFYSYSDGDHWFEWSPDSRWLAVQFYNRGRIFYTEVGLVAADGTEGPIDLSKSGYNDMTPHFAMDGGAVVWATDRFGQRAHGSWGAEYDVVAKFLTQDAHDRFRLSKEEYELRKELEEKQKEDDADDDDENGEDGETGDDDADGDNGDAEENGDTDEVEPIEIDLDGIDTRMERLTIHASDLGGFALAPEGDKLFYLARFEKGYDLWVHDFREESTKILTKLGASSASMVMSDEGDAVFVLADGSLAKIDAASGERTGISFAAEMNHDPAAEREHLLGHVWRQTEQKFYRPDMHGVDWAFYREQYEPKLAGVKNNRDFAIILSEMLGELNASHTGGRYFPGAEEGDASTASLGVFHRKVDGGPGFEILEIMENGPLDRAELDLEAGDVLLAIDGVRLDDRVNLFHQLDNKAGDRVRLTVRDASENNERDVVVRPVSLGQESQLRYERWVRQREAIVQEASDGRLGYAHVRGMNDASFRAFFQDVLGKHFDKEALIVDTRFNGGGWLHDDLATFLSGEEYVRLYPRNDFAPGKGYAGDPAERWNNPSVVVMSESNYSDAHFFPWVYKELGIGETVGMPVPGTATAVWWERLFTGDLVFGIPQVGTKGADGDYLENKQLEPTHLVRLDPESAAAGDDTQLEAAVRVLLNDLSD